MYPNQTVLQSPKFRRILAVLAVFFVLIAGLAVFASSRFHVVGTSPSADEFNISTPSITLKFNKPVSSSGFKITGTSNIIRSFTISGKDVIVSLNGGLSLNARYSITIIHAVSTTGQAVNNKTLVFIAKNIAFEKLSSDQQKAILKTQATVPYSKNSITYVGTDSLTTNGITTNQLNDFEQAIFDYSQQISKQFSKVTVDDSTVRAGAHDPNSASMNFSLTFSLIIDGTLYNANFVYSGLNTGELFLSNETGQQIFDSGLLNLGS